MSKKHTFKNNTLVRIWPFIRLSSLQRTLLLFVVLPLVLLSALGIRFGLDQANQFQQQRLKNDLELIARAISLPVGTALNNQDLEAVNLALDSVFVLGEVYGASVFDVAGNRIASAGVSKTNLTDSSIPARILSTGEGQEVFTRVKGRRLFSHFLPLFDAVNRTQGLIQIARRAWEFGRALEQLAVIAWLVWGVFSLGMLAAVLLGHYGGVGRHVDKLLTHMQRVAAGDLSHRAALEGPNEVASIAQGLNQMLDSINQANQELDAHRAAETQLLAQLKDTEKMVAIGSMAQGIAHELGAPLSVIDGRARRLELSGQLDQKTLRHVKGIRSQVDRLTRTVRQLLDYCRPAATQVRELAPAQLIADVIAAIEPELEARHCKLSADIPDNLPTIRGDAGRLELALLNLVRNALQAAEHSIGIAVSSNAEQLSIIVTDDGAGLPTDFSLERLLEPFFTTKSPGQGTGLGLAIVRTVSEEHDGQLSFNNRAQGGCEVRLTLPISLQTKDKLR